MAEIRIEGRSIPCREGTRSWEAEGEKLGSGGQGAEKDVLVVGDYNMIPGQDFDNFRAMNPDWYLNFVSRSQLPAGSISHITGNGGSLLDGYAVSKEHTKEYVQNSIAVVDLPAMLGISRWDYTDRISDHLPLTAAFNVSQDDD
jgi:hypothetical protein